MNRSTSTYTDRCGYSVLELFVTIGVISILLALLLPAVQNARSAARAVQCQNKMKQLGIAAQEVYDRTGRYPDVFADIPWTVEFLPYLEQGEMQERVMGAINSNDLVILSELGHDTLTEFICPQSTDNSHSTSGLALASYALNFEVCVSQYSAGCQDGRSNTMLATEMERNREAWLEGPVRVMEPFDSPHNKYGHLLLCDGSVRKIGFNTDASILQALETPNGGELLEDF